MVSKVAFTRVSVIAKHSTIGVHRIATVLDIANLDIVQAVLAVATIDARAGVQIDAFGARSTMSAWI
jgi:hypothetical protein